MRTTWMISTLLLFAHSASATEMPATKLQLASNYVPPPIVITEAKKLSPGVTNHSNVEEITAIALANDANDNSSPMNNLRWLNF